MSCNDVQLFVEQKGAAGESLTFWVGIDLEGVGGSQNMLQRPDKLQEGERAGGEDTADAF